MGQGEQNNPQESHLTTVADKNGTHSSMGYGSDSDSQNSITRSGINTQNIQISDEAEQIRLTGKTVEQTKAEIQTKLSTEALQDNPSLSGSLNNVFDKEAVQNELDLQRTVSQSFNQNVQAANTEINKHIDELKAKLDDPKTSAAEKAEIKDKISDWQLGQVLLNSIAAGLTAPTQSGAGIAAATASPALSYAIGQEFKKLAGQNEDGKLTAGQQTAHILAHAVLGAAVAAAGDNSAIAGAISAGGAEAAAPYISNWLYGETDGSKLTAEQKETVAAITGLLGTAAGATIGNTTADAVQGSLNAQSAVKNNSQLFDDLRDWTKEKAENAATVARELFPNTPAISGFLLGLGDVANGGLGLTDAAAESLAMAIHCIGGLDYCNTATTNNQERGRILLDTAKAVTDGRIKTALEYWGNSLLYGTPEQQRQATEQLARVSTTLGIGSAVSSPRINPLYRPVAVVSNTKVGIQWNAGIGKQGYPWEDYVGKNLPVEARLPKNFKTFDYYDVSTKTAISAKTLDTQTASRLSKPEQIYSTMKGYIDKVASFTEYQLSGIKLEASIIAKREIHLAIPATTNAAQKQQLQRVIEYGRSRNVQIKITEIK